MKDIIHPYQWELLAAMITFKVTNGLCLDYERLKGSDFELISEEQSGLPLSSIKQWFNGRRPASDAFDLLCKYISDVFPYSTWDEFSEQENDLDVFHVCPDWRTYQRYKKAERETSAYRKLEKVKNWAYGRVVTLAKRNWPHTGFNFLHRQDYRIKEFVGQYNYFMPGQIPPVNFKDVYVDPISLDEEGEVKFQNAYNKNRFHGHATIMDDSTLQIFVFSKNKDRKTGCEYVINVRLNKYGATAHHFPGVALGFDGQGNIYAYPIFLTRDLRLEVDSPLVKEFFNHCYKQFAERAYTGRLECLSPVIILDLLAKTGYTEKNTPAAQ